MWKKLLLIFILYSNGVFINAQDKETSVNEKEIWFGVSSGLNADLSFLPKGKRIPLVNLSIESRGRKIIERLKIGASFSSSSYTIDYSSHFFGPPKSYSYNALSLEFQYNLLLLKKTKNFLPKIQFIFNYTPFSNHSSSYYEADSAYNFTRTYSKYKGEYFNVGIKYAIEIYLNTNDNSLLFISPNVGIGFDSFIDSYISFGIEVGYLRRKKKKS